MVFSKIMNDMNNIFNNSKKEDSHNKKIIDKLINQGKLHNRNKQNKINRVNKQIVENNTNIFSKGDKKIQDIKNNTSSVLNSIKTQYESDLTDWATAHKTFMDNYTTFMGNIKSCEVDCQNTYKGEKINRDNKINACKNGCKLRQPILMDATNDATYLDSNGSPQALDCTNLIGKCSNGYVDGLGSAQATPEQIKGCTECGGGSGGAPIIRQQGANPSISKNIKSCNDVDDAYNNKGANTTSLVTMCQNGYNNAKLTSSGYDFKSKYSELVAYNKKLDTSAKALESESKEWQTLKKIKSELNKINGVSIGEEGFKTMDDLITEYDNIQSEINKLRGRKNNNKTSEAQLEDVELKIKSERMQLYIWSGLAILTMLLVIQKIKQ